MLHLTPNLLTGFDASVLGLVQQAGNPIYFTGAQPESFLNVPSPPSGPLKRGCPLTDSGNQLAYQSGDAKRTKLDQIINTKVVHIRNVPTDSSETEIIALGLPFGRVMNKMILKSKSQAFLELETEEAAAAMVNYYMYVSPTINGLPVYVQLSTYKELRTEDRHQKSSSVSPTGSATENHHCVLRVVVENMLYPITLDIFHQVFSKHGIVLKIITFTKNNQYQALIQYSDAVAAAAARVLLDGQNVYNDCCTLKIDYSKLTNLNVKYNNEKSRDFTRNDLPPAEGILPIQANPLQTIDLLNSGLGYPSNLLSLQYPMAATQFQPQHMGIASPMQLPIGHPFNTLAPSQLAAINTIRQLSGQPAPGSVILVSNLNAEMTTPDGIFVLFGVYGDVQRVKILYNKQDNALIQMSDPMQAQHAIAHLNGIKLHGKILRVALSKYQVVQLPKEGTQQAEADLTKDYTNSLLHRFKKPGSKNFGNIYAPSQVLHLSNIPDHIIADDLTDAFKEKGFSVHEFRFFSKDHKMALIKLDSVEEALVALMEMHNHQLSENQHLRVSFAKSGI